jgi:putative flippase GtrA
MVRKWIDGTLLRFLLVGVINTLVGCGTMFLLYNLANCSYWASSAANYLVGGIVSFFLNKYFTFRKKEWSWGQVVRFAGNVAVCWLLAYGMARPLVLRLLEGQSLRLQENVAMFVGMGLYTALNYLGQRFFAFRADDR